MLPRPAAFLLLIGALAALTGCPERRRPTAEGPPARVVTLTPTSTELVAAAGCLARIVGVDRYSLHPPAVAALPRVGDFIQTDVEAILALHPDLAVLDETQRRAAAKLEAAGIPTLALEAHGIADVLAGLARVGDALGTRPEADRAIAGIEAAVAATRARGAARQPKVRVLVVVDRQPGGLRSLVAAGPGSYVDELVVLAGGENVLVGTDVRYPKIGADRVVELRPEVILDATHGGDLGAWRELARVAAVAGGRVHGIAEPLFQAPTPRVAEALARVEAVLYPPR